MAYLCGSNVGDSSGNLGERFGSERGKALREREMKFTREICGKTLGNYFLHRKNILILLYFISKKKKGFAKKYQISSLIKKKKRNIKYLRHGNCRRFDFNLSKAGSPDSEFGFLKLI
jgi:hypothetical protein